MILGITGTVGAGEKVRGTFARPCQIFFEAMKKNIDKVYSSCKERVRFTAPDIYLSDIHNHSRV